MGERELGGVDLRLDGNTEILAVNLGIVHIAPDRIFGRIGTSIASVLYDIEHGRTIAVVDIDLKRYVTCFPLTVCVSVE